MSEIACNAIINSPIGLKNNGNDCWLISILISLESCQAFTSILEKYSKSVLADENQQTLLCALTKYFKYKIAYVKDKTENKMFDHSLFLNVRDVFVAKGNVATNEGGEAKCADNEKPEAQDVNDALTDTETMLCKNLHDIKCDWARDMEKDLMTLFDVAVHERDKCLEKECHAAEIISDQNDGWFFRRRIKKMFKFSGSKGKSVAKPRYLLQKHLSTYDSTEVKGVFCSGRQCNGSSIRSRFSFNKFPLVLIISFPRAYYENGEMKVDCTPIEFPMRMKLFAFDNRSARYEFRAVIESVNTREEKEELITHFVATVVSGEGLYKIDDELVKEQKFPKERKTSSTAVVFMYQRTDWDAEGMSYGNHGSKREVASLEQIIGTAPTFKPTQSDFAQRDPRGAQEGTELIKLNPGTLGITVILDRGIRIKDIRYDSQCYGKMQVGDWIEKCNGKSMKNKTIEYFLEMAKNLDGFELTILKWNRHYPTIAPSHGVTKDIDANEPKGEKNHLDSCSSVKKHETTKPTLVDRMQSKSVTDDVEDPFCSVQTQKNINQIIKSYKTVRKLIHTDLQLKEGMEVKNDGKLL